MKQFQFTTILSFVLLLGGCMNFARPSPAHNNQPQHQLSAQAQEIKIAADVVSARLRQAENTGDWDALQPFHEEIFELALVLLPPSMPVQPVPAMTDKAAMAKPAMVEPSMSKPVMLDAKVIAASLGTTLAPPPVLQQSRSLFFAIQLGSYRTMERAFAGWDELRAAAPEVLTDFRPKVERVDLGDRGVFLRLKAGPLAKQSAVTDTCNTLHSKGMACIRADFTGVERP